MNWACSSVLQLTHDNVARDPVLTVINVAEFVRLQPATDKTKATLITIFNRWVGNDGSLDFGTFQAIAKDCALFDDEDEIVHLGTEVNRWDQHIEKLYSKDNLWKLGLGFDKRKTCTAVRPSLADISNLGPDV